MPFRPEPPYPHGSVTGQPKTGILLVNLGTPDEPTPVAVRRYLREFLSDPRVVEIPRLLWLMILHLFILPTRPAQSAKKYALIWTREGSPLKVWSVRQAKLLQGLLGVRGHAVRVECGMRYGNPGIPAVLDKLKAEGCERILVLPLYPQYSATTSASTIDAVNAWSNTVRNVPEIRFVKHYHDNSFYIDALAAQVRAYWESKGLLIWEGRHDARLVLSFHGVPKRTLMLGDPYHCECLKTGRLLAEALGLEPNQVIVSFQSRFGKAEWLQPYTAPTLEKLAREGVKRVDIFCPGFPADCLETLEEIAIEGRQLFTAAGGAEYRYIPCMNDRQEWIVALTTIAEQHMLGWPTFRLAAAEEVIAVAKARKQRDLARMLGAPP